MAYRILAVLVVAALVGGGGYRLGRSLERADWVERDLDGALAAAQAARLAAEAEARRAAAVAAQAQRVQTRVQHVKAAAPPPDPRGCRLTDPERLRLDAIYAAYFGDPTAPGGLPGRLHDPAAADRAEHRGGLHRDAAGLGLRVPDAAR